MLGAYLVMFPTNRVTVFLFRFLMPVPAIVAIGMWAVLQFISGFGALNGWILLQGEMPRVLAREGIFPQIFARESRYGTPGAALFITSALGTPLVLSVHTIVSFDFAVSLLPGWHTTIFPPYFVAGAIFSGIAGLLAGALSESRDGNFLTRTLREVTGGRLSRRLELEITYSNEAVERFVRSVSKTVDAKPREGKSKASFVGIRIRPSRNGPSLK